eukprot:772971-Prymnesium_polylepis.1
MCAGEDGKSALCNQPSYFNGTSRENGAAQRRRRVARGRPPWPSTAPERRQASCRLRPCPAHGLLAPCDGTCTAIELDKAAHIHHRAAARNKCQSFSRRERSSPAWRSGYRARLLTQPTRVRFLLSALGGVRLSVTW